MFSGFRVPTRGEGIGKRDIRKQGHPFKRPFIRGDRGVLWVGGGKRGS